MLDFEFHTPATVQDALQLLSSNPEARIIAGGTDLTILMKDLLIKPASLVSLDKIEGLADITSDADGLHVGPMAPLWLLERNEHVQKTYPALAQAISHLAAPPIRNKGTLGGNICLDPKCIYYNQSRVWRRSLPDCFKAGGNVCHVLPAGKRCVGALAAETAGPLCIYNAEITIASSQGSRTTPMAGFFTGDGIKPHALDSSEMITSIRIPKPASRYGSAYHRFAYRKALEFSQFNIAAAVGLDNDSRIETARLIFGAIGPRPVEVKESLSHLAGQTPSKELWAEAALEAPREAVKLSKSPRLTSYLQEVARAYTERILEQACNDAAARRT